MKLTSCSLRQGSIALFLLAWISAAPAQTSGPYLKLDAGINYIQNTSFKAAGFPGDISFDSGYRIVAAAGYELSRWLAVELEGGFFDNSISTVKLRGLTTHVHKSSLSAVPILANVLFRYENSSDFIPYVGIGAGGSRSTLRIEAENDDQILFAVQAQLGVIYRIDEQAWLEVGYRLLGTPEGKYDLGGLHVESDNVISHFFGIGAIWKF